MPISFQMPWICFKARGKCARGACMKTPSWPSSNCLPSNTAITTLWKPFNGPLKRSCKFARGLLTCSLCWKRNRARENGRLFENRVAFCSSCLIHRNELKRTPQTDSLYLKTPWYQVLWSQDSWWSWEGQKCENLVQAIWPEHAQAVLPMLMLWSKAVNAGYSWG